MVKLTKVKAGKLSDLLKSVYEGVTVYEELSRGLGNVKVVLEEALYCHVPRAWKPSRRLALG